MDYYKLLLVDDEEEVRRSIVNKLDWPSLGFELVGEAANGEEALEMCETLAPDVIMTDIQMPFMDGLTLCRQAKQLLPGVKTAIFSGFDEFDYAKEAIKLEVEEYILKPIDAAELQAVFRRIKDALDSEVANRRDVARLRRYYEQSLPVMRQQLLSDLLEGHIDLARIDTLLQEYDMDLSAECYCTAVIRFEQDNPEATLYTYSLQDIVADTFAGEYSYRLLPSFERLALLFLLPADADILTVAERLNSLFLPAKKLLGLRLSIGLGRVYKAREEITQSYSEALGAIEYQGLVGSGQCIYIGDVKPATVEADVWDLRHIDEVMRQIKIGRKEDLQAAFDALRQHARTGQMGRGQQQMLQLGMITELLKVIKDYQLDAQAEELSNHLLERSIHPAQDTEEALHWLQESCEELRRLLSRQRGATTKKIVETAKQYIEANFADNDLSVDTLCGILNVSPAYFSSLFKKETGESFVAYLTRLRMEKALEYLGATDEKTYLIAEQVGYSDPNYFSYVFKRNYGVSPSKYRQDRMADHEPG